MDKMRCMAVIQAGGKGTRMVSMTRDRIPKPMLELGGKPLLLWQVEQLRRYGIREIVFIIGHLGERIRAYFGSGERLGVHIRYVEEKEPMGSGGALAYLRGLPGDIGHVLLVLGDVMFDMDISRFVDAHASGGGAVTLLVHPNGHPQDSDLVVLEEPLPDAASPVLGSHGGRVLRFDDKSNARDYNYANCVNAGLYLLEPEVIRSLGEARPMDLEREILLPYLEQGLLFAYRTTEYVKDVGTPERFRRAEKELAAGIWALRNLERPQRGIFLDRDGTLNVYRGLISSPEGLELLPGAAEAVKSVNGSGYLSLVVSNQPVVARGLATVEGVREIHRRMEVLLGREGAYLDDIAFCPHHPDRGYPEEDPRYKIPCACRKPDVGMVEALSSRWHVDAASSWLIGDSARDILCGKRAGLRTALVRTGEWNGSGLSMEPDIVAEDVGEAVERILGEGT